jgi:hypothetical protein
LCITYEHNVELCRLFLKHGAKPEDIQSAKVCKYLLDKKEINIYQITDVKVLQELYNMKK